jgi:transposase-like protein
MKCPKCNTERVVKNGSGRLLCRNCKKTFSLKNPKYSFEFKLECIKLYIRGMGVRAIAEEEYIIL